MTPVLSHTTYASQLFHIIEAVLVYNILGDENSTGRAWWFQRANLLSCCYSVTRAFPSKNTRFSKSVSAHFPSYKYILTINGTVGYPPLRGFFPPYAAAPNKSHVTKFNLAVGNHLTNIHTSTDIFTTTDKSVLDAFFYTSQIGI